MRQNLAFLRVRSTLIQEGLLPANLNITPNRETLMRLLDIDFSPVATASGAQGFFSSWEYMYHLPWCCLGKTHHGCTRIAKTTTVEARLKPAIGKGNMRMTKDGIRPLSPWPDCISINFRKLLVVNAVGLSNPGAAALMATGKWQRRRGNPHMISFMSVMPTKDERLQEAREFVRLALLHLLQPNARMGLEANISCPNSDINPLDLISEIGELLDILGILRRELGMPIQIKFGPDAPIPAIVEIARQEMCDGLTLFNSLGFGKLPDVIPWTTIFPNGSPLAKYGGGALSGPLLRDHMLKCIHEVRGHGINIPISACGGIYYPEDAVAVADVGGSGVQIGSVSFMRPWQTGSICRQALQLFT